jgi:capsule polysaccharide export protein KpsE/RkpR
VYVVAKINRISIAMSETKIFRIFMFILPLSVDYLYFSINASNSFWNAVSFFCRSTIVCLSTMPSASSLSYNAL